MQPQMQARAAEPWLVVDERDLEPQLTGAECGRITAGAAAENDQVEAVGGADCHAQTALSKAGDHALGWYRVWLHWPRCDPDSTRAAARASRRPSGCFRPDGSLALSGVGWLDDYLGPVLRLPGDGRSDGRRGLTNSRPPQEAPHA